MLNLRLRCLSLLSFLALASLPAQAITDEDVAKLLASPLQPTMGEFLAYFPEWPGPKPLNAPANYPDYLTYLRQQLPGMATLIVDLESAFPGGTYAFVGRDVGGIRDFVDAFYHSIGQPNRVSRIDMSSGSFLGATNDQLVQVLRGAGYSPESIQENAPFIIVDGTSYSETSQTRRLLKAAYRDLEARYGRRREFFHKVNVFNSYRRAFNHPPTREFIDSVGFGRDGEPDREVVTTATVAMATSFWHDSFGTPVLYPDGKLRGARGSLFDQNARFSVLYLMALFYDEAQKPEFLELVRSEARRMGVRDVWQTRRAEPLASVPCEAGFGI